MKIASIKPGMVLWSKGKQRMGNTMLRRTVVWQVVIKAVNLEKETVEASWNGNPTRTFTKATWSKWTKKRPEIKC